MRFRIAAAAGLLILILAAVAGYALWQQKQQRIARDRAEAERKAKAAQAAAAVISIPGKIQARNVVNLAPPIAGVVDELLVNPGDQVFEGQVLARIHNSGLDAAQATAKTDLDKAQAKETDLEAQLIAARLDASRTRADVARARVEYDRTQKVFERQKLLFEADATPRLSYEKAQKDFETAKSEFDGYSTNAQTAEDRVASLTKDIEVAKALVESKNKDLENASAHAGGGEMRSPLNGMVVGLQSKAGDNVDPGMKDMIVIATDLSALEVVADADPATAQKIRQGQPALIQIAEAPSPIEGAVREIKSGQVFVDFTSPSAAIKPGLTAQVKLKVG